MKRSGRQMKGSGRQASREPDHKLPGRLVSHFLLFVSHFFSFVSHFFSFVSQAGCLWSGSRPACLPPPFICLPVLFTCLPVLVVGFPLACLPLPFICLPLLFICLLRLGACGRVLGWLVSHFLSVVSQARCLWSGSRRLVSHFLECVSHFFSFASQAGCLWPGSCLRGPSLLVPCSISIHLSFRSVTGGVRPCPLAMTHFYSFVSQVRYCCCPPFSVDLSPRSVTAGARPFRRPCSISIH